jgi:hypothetical protein
MPSFASSPPRPVRGGVSSSSFVIFVLFSFFVTNDDVSDYICIFPTPDTLHQPLFLRLFVGVVLYTNVWVVGRDIMLIDGSVSGVGPAGVKFGVKMKILLSLRKNTWRAGR